MTRSLGPESIERYRRDGVLWPVRAFETDTGATRRAQVEALGREHAAGAAAQQAVGLYAQDPEGPRP